MTIHPEDAPQKQTAAEEERPILPVLPRSEITEEEKNFVPDFNNEAIAAKQKRKAIILIVLLIFAAAVGGLIFYGRYYSFYKRTMENLQFNYIRGEVIDTETQTPFAECGIALAKLAEGESLSFTAAAYTFDADRKCLPTVSQYRYTRSGTEETLVEKIGVNGSFLTKKRSYPLHSENPNDPELSGIRDFLFGAEDHGEIKIHCADSYNTRVGDQPCLCELWLMSMPYEGRTIYYTLYRYYKNKQLVGVRMLSSETELMTVYDVTSYSFQ